LEIIKAKIEKKIDRINKELIEKNNRLKESFNSIKRETNLGNEIQIHVKKSILKL